MMLQTLVENALKHGVGAISGPGIVALGVSLTFGITGIVTMIAATEIANRTTSRVVCRRA